MLYSFLSKHMKIIKYNHYNKKKIRKCSLKETVNWELEGNRCSANLFDVTSGQKTLNNHLVELMLMLIEFVENDDKNQLINNIVDWVNENTSGDFRFKIKDDQ